MCRFLLLSSDEPCGVQQVVEQFARMCEQSTCLDGDWQGDGWGVAWWREGEGWSLHRVSGADLDRDGLRAPNWPATRRLVVHARAASFPEHKGDLAFAQPYVHGPLRFRTQRSHCGGAPTARHEDSRCHRGRKKSGIWCGKGWRKASCSGRPWRGCTPFWSAAAAEFRRATWASATAGRRRATTAIPPAIRTIKFIRRSAEACA